MLCSCTLETCSAHPTGEVGRAGLLAGVAECVACAGGGGGAGQISASIAMYAVCLNSTNNAPTVTQLESITTGT